VPNGVFLTFLRVIRDYIGEIGGVGTPRDVNKLGITVRNE